MAESIVLFAVEKIGTLLIEEKRFLGSVSGEVKELQEEFMRMQRFLKDADKRQDESESVRGWVSDIRDLAYDVEDVIDSFISNISSKHKSGLWNKTKRYALIPTELMDKHRLANEINTIRGKLTNLTNSLQTYGITRIDVPGNSSEPHIRQRRTHAYINEDYTVGLDNDVQILLRKLVDQPKEHQVVSIYGMGGLGKSTLAKKLYHHNDVKSNFDAFAWVFVSQQFRVRQISEEILIQLSSLSEKERISKLSDDKVSEELYQLQQAKKCLVVIDDLWEKEHWDDLKHAFPIRRIKGTIFLTTRNKALGLHVDPTCFNHEPRTLSYEESWELFQMKAFTRSDYTDITAMEELGKEMVKLCSGLPLAIIVLGGVLATKSSLKEWSSAHKTFGTYRKGEDNEYSNIHAILALSYSELPYHLKPCFLSLAQFPEDYSIRSKILFRLWMAQGIVTREPLEDSAESYLQELVDRCLLQIEKMGLSGGIKTCRLHDLIRDLSLSKANQENFLKFIHDNPENSKARRVTVGSGNPKACLDSLKENRRHMRSLTIRSCILELSEVREFKLLRVLELDSCEIKVQSMKEIGALIHLKYLRITKSYIGHIPSTLGNLKSLQTFIIHSGGATLTISKKIWNLQELTYLHIKCYGQALCTTELQVKKLRNLRTLRCTGLIYIEGLENLPNLRNLETWVGDVENLPKVLNSIAAPEKMTTFTAFIGNSETWFSEVVVRDLLSKLGQLQKLRFSGKMEKFPEVCSNLTKLTLTRSKLNEDPMGILGRFSNLTFLDLDYAFEGRTMVCSAIGFPKLKILHLKQLFNLVEWRVEKGSMASLCHLLIEDCYSLEIPNFEFITTLSQLQINGVPTGFKDRLEGEDFDKVRHIASITITW